MREVHSVRNSLEAWSVALSVPRVWGGGEGRSLAVYAGGDDSVLRCTSLASVCYDDDEAEPAVVLRRHHDAGVTAILPIEETATPVASPSQPRLVLTGSYDDRIRLMAITDPSLGGRRAELLAEADLGGGVWRLKLIDDDGGSDGGKARRIRVLASCMHAGARVVEFLRANEDGGRWTVCVLARFEAHASMNYASDCWPLKAGTGPGGDAQKKLRCVSTSFYDRLLCLWEVGLDTDR